MPGMTGWRWPRRSSGGARSPCAAHGLADELDAAQPRHVDVLLAKPVTRERLANGLAKAAPDRVRPG